MSELNILKDQIPFIFEDFKKYYVFYNKNTDNNEYRQIFENIKNNLQKTSINLVQIGNKINNNTNLLNKELDSLNKQITKEKEKNKKYKKLYGSLETEKNASNELVDDYVKTYNKYYNENFLLMVGILFTVFITHKIYSNKNI